MKNINDVIAQLPYLVPDVPECQARRLGLPQDFASAAREYFAEAQEYLERADGDPASAIFEASERLADALVTVANYFPNLHGDVPLLFDPSEEDLNESAILEEAGGAWAVQAKSFLLGDGTPRSEVRLTDLVLVNDSPVEVVDGAQLVSREPGALAAAAAARRMAEVSRRIPLLARILSSQDEPWAFLDASGTQSQRLRTVTKTGSKAVIEQYRRYLGWPGGDIGPQFSEVKQAWFHQPAIAGVSPLGWAFVQLPSNPAARP